MLTEALKKALDFNPVSGGSGKREPLKDAVDVITGKGAAAVGGEGSGKGGGNGKTSIYKSLLERMIEDSLIMDLDPDQNDVLKKKFIMPADKALLKVMKALNDVEVYNHLKIDVNKAESNWAKLFEDCLFDLARIMRSQVGKDLIENLAAGGVNSNLTTINISDKNKIAHSYAVHRKHNDPLNGNFRDPNKGDHSIVKYRPGKPKNGKTRTVGAYKVYIKPSDRIEAYSYAGRLLLKNRHKEEPIFVVSTSDTILFHELVHCYHYVNGTSIWPLLLSEKEQQSSVDKFKKYHIEMALEEDRATGVGVYSNENFNENTYRSQQRARNIDSGDLYPHRPSYL